MNNNVFEIKVGSYVIVVPDNIDNQENPKIYSAIVTGANDLYVGDSKKESDRLIRIQFGIKYRHLDGVYYQDKIIVIPDIFIFENEKQFEIIKYYFYKGINSIVDNFNIDNYQLEEDCLLSAVIKALIKEQVAALYDFVKLVITINTSNFTGQYSRGECMLINSDSSIHSLLGGKPSELLGWEIKEEE